MGISLEKAIEIVCSEGNSTVVSKEVFNEHIEKFGVNLMVEFYQYKDTEDDVIFYRDVRDNDVVALSMGGDVAQYRTVNIQPDNIFGDEGG